jgi:hypothetical protein
MQIDIAPFSPLLSFLLPSFPTKPRTVSGTQATDHAKAIIHETKVIEKHGE